MSGDKSKYALGTDTYTLADGFVTTMLTFCSADKFFWKTEVETRPVLYDYYQRMKSRPSFKEAEVGVQAVPGNGATCCGLTVFLLFVWSLVFGLVILIYYLAGGVMESCISHIFEAEMADCPEKMARSLAAIQFDHSADDEIKITCT